MKNRIITLLVSLLVVGCLTVCKVDSISADKQPYFYDVQIDKKGEILGDGDIINVSCRLAQEDMVLNDCICWINAYSSNIYFSLYYNEATDCYEGSYIFGETIDNPTRACYIMMIESFERKITTYWNEEVHPFGMCEFYYCNQCKEGIHYPVIEKSRDATCTDEGLTEGIYCSLCSTLIQEQESIPANGHTWDDGVTTKKATCKDNGEITYTCKVCGVVRIEKIAKLSGHTPGPEVTATENQVCIICGEILKKATGEIKPSEDQTNPITQPTMPVTESANPVTEPTTAVTEPAISVTESTTAATELANTTATTQSNQNTPTLPCGTHTSACFLFILILVLFCVAVLVIVRKKPGK